MGPPVVVPAEEVVESLLRHFVAPLLPRRYVSPRTTQTVDQQIRLGKQMQAVVVLYNYYQRKQSRKLRFMDFRSFCETACISNSSLVYYMKFISQGAGSLEDVHGQLSIIEKMIMDACDICAALDASIDVINMDGWPISKVAVFLVDAAKQKCLLKNGSIILGSWSLIEKELEAPLEKSADSREAVYAFKNKGIVDESVKLYGFEDFPQEIAYSIVEQDMGITRSNLSILECHLSYSLNQLKSSTLLYIMNYKEPDSSGVEVSIEDVISLHGLPVECSSCDMKPEITSVAEHYCLLPYIDFIAEWASRKTSLGCSLNSLEQKANLKGCFDDHLITASHQMGGKSDLNKGTCNDDLLHPMHQKVDMNGKFYDGDYTESNHQDIGTYNDDLSSVVIFQLLKKRRDELCFQQRLMEDFIAQLEMNIQTIICGENLNSQSELITKASDFLRSSNVTKGANSFAESQLQPLTNRRKRLFDADLRLRNSCQELDEICSRNNWILPKYMVFPSPEEGKFQALLTVKGMDFEFTVRGDSKDGPTEARESAVAFMLSKLQDMTSHAHKH